ncbi:MULTISPECIES: expansin EXLX1 family cellulose-binding protein [unclassified Frankia]|uniref:expansin EXLX1 family cellulose-binding protein n=1 Tax=unclassified Frankia TaxID=2632575 RepID=UPI002AD56645|nr:MULTISPECIES: expansin EXLX1 family cellulose-binding protein [unclassified Frankia]
MTQSPPAGTSMPRHRRATQSLPARLHWYSAVAVLTGTAAVLSIITSCQPTELTSQPVPITATSAQAPGAPSDPRPTPPSTQPASSSAPTSATTATQVPPATTTHSATPTVKPGGSAAATRPATQPPGQGSTPVTPGRIRPGVTYTGDGTFYTLGDGTGNCLYEGAGLEPGHAYAALNEADYENARMCGGYVRATGPRGTVVVKIVDRCPECKPGDIDFSPEAFATIADPVAGRVPISWQLISPANIGNLQYRIKEGSSAYWLAIQPRNHRNPVVSLEISVNGIWQALPREQYNYFLAPNGLGAGPFTVRVTDIYGQQIVNSGITLSPTTVQSTASQFAQH